MRDVFDIVVAEKFDPHALAIAVNTRTARDIAAIATAWRTSNPVFAYNAPLDLSGVQPEFAVDLTSLGHAAAAALTGARYERVRMYTDGNVGFVETRTRHGADRKLTVDPTRIDELFEANGLNHYLPQTGARPVEIRERMRTAFRKGAEFVHDTASGAKT